MAVGLGLSIGTVNTVSALADDRTAKAPPGRRRTAERAPAVTRRTTLTFDSTGLARVGMIPKHGRAITEFADLSQRTAASARVGHRALSPADLVATVADCLIVEARRDPRAVAAGITLTHPVGYTEHQVGELRAALDAIGLDRVALVAEPIAAAAWLEAEHGPLMPGLALIYDLGGSGLDVTLLRVGAGCPENPIVGMPVRSADFGGRAFGSLVAARAGANGRAAHLSEAVRGATADELRADHVRASLELVYRCLRAADVTMADVDCVLVVGGAARPDEVPQVLSEELARPVVIAPDPERTIADGAAILARRTAAAREDPSQVRRRTGAHRRGPDSEVVPAWLRSTPRSGRRSRPTRALLFSRLTRRRLTRAATAVGMSAGGVALAFALPADAVIAGLGVH
ncbi:Hsp70 family protein [Nocardia goodfellowii]|uniref:Molecular chaperone HscA n=1 Tax=Nocardia goodfellowii TaxID=882446 RepID=A0ABS4QSL1_9NOCA|nr:Hsp70 family protein [Nocardia goodfellowii]MBP2194063.1 molecular chaperone HscA [Nocardia goodfellowii]